MPNNPLFQALGGNAAPAMPNLNAMNQIMEQFQRFKNAFQGDPKQQVQQLLNSGRMSQVQYNQLAQMANQFQNMLK